MRAMDGPNGGGINAVVSVRTIMNQLVAEAEPALLRIPNIEKQISRTTNTVA
jgi:hypothetical protein